MTIRIILPCLLLLAACLPAQAVPFRISNVDGLSFGTFAPGSTSSGTVTISVNGTRSRTGGVSLISAQAGNAARFLVTGNNATVYSVSLPSQAVLTASGGKSMNITDFFSSPSDTSAYTGYLNGNSQYLYVGATLSVAANQGAGYYSGTFSVIVDNQ